MDAFNGIIGAMMFPLKNLSLK